MPKVVPPKKEFHFGKAPQEVYLSLPKNNLVIRLKKDQNMIDGPRDLMTHFECVHMKQKKYGFHRDSEFWAYGTCQLAIRKSELENANLARTRVKLKEVAEVKTNVPLDRLQDGDIVLSRVGASKRYVGKPHFIKSLKMSGR